jgi:hypothetical protein
MAQFIPVGNKVVNVDSIAYVDFLESGRAMVFMRGLTQEKQNISVDPADARILRAFFETESGPGSDCADQDNRGKSDGPNGLPHGRGPVKH